MSSADEITLDEFQRALARYPAVIKDVSDSKGSKSGQKTLVELDEYRYNEVPERFGLAAPEPESMGLDDVKTLVEWKLRHGKFRPTLMNLVTSNEPKTVTATVDKAIKSYKSNANASAAVDTLATLRGIGPATASLLLAVHDPARVVFFGDEVFYWLCCNGKVAPIKYNMKEYRELQQRASDVVERLGVEAVDVEKVAFVVMRGGDAGKEGMEPVQAKTKAGKSADVKPSKAAKDAKRPAAAKRKHESADTVEAVPAPGAAPVRRSKREKRT